MKVINIFGGPGVGKTTQAHELFVEMKKKGYSVEFIPEVAKFLAYQNNSNLEGRQLELFYKQIEPYKILDNKVDYVIAECPLALSSVYNRIHKGENDFFEPFVMGEFQKYENINIFLKRETDYKQEGRYQNKYEAINVDKVILNLLSDYNIHFTYLGLTNFVNEVLKIIIKHG